MRRHRRGKGEVPGALSRNRNPALRTAIPRAGENGSVMSDRTYAARVRAATTLPNWHEVGITAHCDTIEIHTFIPEPGLRRGIETRQGRRVKFEKVYRRDRRF